MKTLKQYVPYVYQCNNVFIDPRTGLMSECNPRIKGDGSDARCKE